MSDSKDSLMVPVGSSEEDGAQLFWALDTSCTRLFAIQENTRVDIIFDMLFDFLGKESHEDIVFSEVNPNKRATKVLQYIQGRVENAKQREQRKQQ